MEAEGEETKINEVPENANIKVALGEIEEKLEKMKQEKILLKRLAEALRLSCESKGHDFFDTGEKGAGWMSFIDPVHGAAMGYRDYTVWKCSQCSFTKGIVQ